MKRNNRNRSRNIWCLDDWKNDAEISNSRTGLRLRFDKEVDLNVKEEFKHAAVWLRVRYEFPVRIVVYIKNKPYLKAQDGTKVYATFFSPFDHKQEPFIRIAVGDYLEKIENWGQNDILMSYIGDMFHELTHYYQWLNRLIITPLGEERQAMKCARTLLEEYKSGDG